MSVGATLCTGGVTSRREADESSRWCGSSDDESSPCYRERADCVVPAQCSVATLGHGDTGQLGLGPGTTATATAARVPLLADVVQVAVGGMHTVCLDVRGKVRRRTCSLADENEHTVHTYIHTYTRLTARLSGTTQVSQYQKGKTNLDFTEARDSEWQWHQLGHMQVCASLQTDDHASTPPLSFLQAGCPSCRPTNSVEALNEHTSRRYTVFFVLVMKFTMICHY